MSEWPAPQRPRPAWGRLLGRIVQQIGLPLLLLVALIGAAVYFSGGSGSTTEPESRPRATPGSVQPAPALPALPPRQAGVSELRAPLPAVSTLDPGVAYDSASIQVVQLLFDGLVGVDSSGRVGASGAQAWSVSPDGLTYTFVLNSAARWSDDRPVVAADYLYAWRRNVDADTASRYAAVLYPIHNAEQINRHGAPPDQLGVQAPDDRTLVVRLARPTPYFLLLAATWPYYPLRRDVLTRFGEMWWRPESLVGNGPYRVEAFNPAGELVLGRNANYQGPQGVDRIRFRATSTAAETLQSYRDNLLDILPLDSERLAEVQKDSRLAPQVRTFPRASTTFIVPNHRRAALTDARVRRALGIALERRILLEQVLKAPGEPALSIHPTGIMGREPAVWPTEDPQAAIRLLAEAGFAGGVGMPELIMAVPDPAMPLVAYLARRWKDTVGVNLRFLPTPSFMALSTSRLWEENVDLYLATWESDYEDPHNWFNLLWDSDQDPQQFNSGWRNADFDRLVRQAQSEMEPAGREALYRQAEQIMARDYPVVPLIHPAEAWLVKPNVRGFNPGRTALTSSMSRIRVEAAGPA